MNAHIFDGVLYVQVTINKPESVDIAINDVAAYPPSSFTTTTCGSIQAVRTIPSIKLYKVV